MQAELIKDVKLSDHDVIELRENFVSMYCGEKGWDKSNLDFEQIMEIRSHAQWKNPGLILG